MDDFDIGVINQALGLPPKEETAAEEKVGDDRLGSGDIKKSFGATLILGSILFAVLILVIVVIIVIAKRIKLSDRRRQQMHNLKAKVFWNPIIRYLILNSLKLTMTALVAFKVNKDRLTDLSSAIGIVAMLNLAPIIFYCTVRANRSKLGDEEIQKVIGAIYMGKNIEKANSNAGLFPMGFFWRRTLFVVVTVYLFDWPSMQMIAHQVLTVLLIISLVADKSAFESTSQKTIEIGSELMLHFSSIMLAQFCIRDYTDAQLSMAEVWTLIFFGSLVLLNVTFIVYVFVKDCKEKRRKKRLEKLKTEHSIKMTEQKIVQKVRLAKKKHRKKDNRKSVLIHEALKEEDQSSSRETTRKEMSQDGKKVKLDVLQPGHSDSVRAEQHDQLIQETQRILDELSEEVADRPEVIQTFGMDNNGDEELAIQPSIDNVLDGAGKQLGEDGEGFEEKRDEGLDRWLAEINAMVAQRKRTEPTSNAGSS